MITPVKIEIMTLILREMGISSNMQNRLTCFTMNAAIDRK